jgi:hypothetical protein
LGYWVIPPLKEEEKEQEEEETKGLPKGGGAEADEEGEGAPAVPTVDTTRHRGSVWRVNNGKYMASPSTAS